MQRLALGAALLSLLGCAGGGAAAGGGLALPANWDDRQRVTRLAWGTPGVSSVIDEMTLDY